MPGEADLLDNDKGETEPEKEEVETADTDPPPAAQPEDELKGEQK